MHSVALLLLLFYYCVVVVVIFCRQIVLHPSAFDSRVKFLEKTRRSFGGGAFNVSEGGLLERYHSSLKEDYYGGVVRRYTMLPNVLVSKLLEKGTGDFLVR